MDWMATEQRQQHKRLVWRDRIHRFKRALYPWVAFALGVGILLNYLPIGAK